MSQFGVPLTRTAGYSCGMQGSFRRLRVTAVRRSPVLPVAASGMRLRSACGSAVRQNIRARGQGPHDVGRAFAPIPSRCEGPGGCPDHAVVAPHALCAAADVPRRALGRARMCDRAGTDGEPFGWLGRPADQPPYRLVADDLRRQILAGGWPPVTRCHLPHPPGGLRHRRHDRPVRRTGPAGRGPRPYRARSGKLRYPPLLAGSLSATADRPHMPTDEYPELSRRIDELDDVLDTLLRLFGQAGSLRRRRPHPPRDRRRPPPPVMARIVCVLHNSR